MIGNANYPKIFLLLFLFILIMNIFSEAKVKLELGTTLNYNIYQSSFNGFPGYDCCGYFTNGKGIGLDFNFSGVYNKLFTLPFAEVNYFTTISLRNISGKFDYEEYFADVIIENKVYRAISRHLLETDIYALSFIPGLEIGNLFGINQTSLRIGPSISIPTKTTFKQKEQLVSPENAFFENHQKERNVFTGKITNFQSPFVGIYIGIGWTFNLGKDFFTTPTLACDIPLNNFVKNIDWKAYRFGLGFSIGYNVPKPSPKPPIPPPPTDFPEPIKPKEFLPIQVQIIVKNNDTLIKEGDTLVVSENIQNYYELKPMPTILFYNHNEFIYSSDSKGIPESNKTVYETNSKILLAVVNYLKANTNENIQVICSQTNDEDENICDKRISTLLDFFKENGLENRIAGINKITSTPKKQIPELIEEQRNIQILFQNGANIVNIENYLKSDTTRRLPQLQIQTQIVPEINSTIENRYYSNNQFYIVKEDKSYKIEPEFFKNPKESSFDSLVFYSKINTIEEIPRQIENRTKIFIKKEFNVENKYQYYNPFNGDNYILVGLFEFDKSEPYWINPKLKEIVNEFLKEGKKVELVGSVDNIGTEEHNQKLALSRAKSLQSKAGTNIPIKILEQNKRKSNQTPIERILNRSAWLRVQM
ncbi:MAG: hypothetical protein N2560_08205 [Ignavibacteria bacterium]|nr:hypothetical protein [Ignavibacteria bacterium]